ncbi:hypothetical protein NMG60_11027739 [Bertholletia excelsa]
MNCHFPKLSNYHKSARSFMSWQLYLLVKFKASPSGRTLLKFIQKLKVQTLASPSVGFGLQFTPK